eukprot:TRINITY_DN2837_c0_g1_i2.p1 TRINITY_DN2837_c0_g1~~TRINITY_DN2837_c0_g1_i2.p1  ORF type:complete len:356 (+),score=78.10 TRINITY_DN2837_c0_g1_i2:71-1069(+)
MAALLDTFYDFAAGSRMDGRGFVKCLRHGGLIDDDFSMAEADLVFTRCKAKGFRKIDFDTFLHALSEVAMRKNLTDQKVQHDLCLGSGYSHGERLLREQSSGQAVGPERFFYDTSRYTGTHRNGGPSASGNGRKEVPVVDFGDLVNRDKINEPAGQPRIARPTSSTDQEPVLLGRTRRPVVALKGPERFFYDKSTYTGTHRNGGPDSHGSGIPKEGYGDLKELVCREHTQNDGLNRRRQADADLAGVVEERRSSKPMQSSPRKMPTSPRKMPNSPKQAASKSVKMPDSPRHGAAHLPVLLGSVGQHPGLAAVATSKLQHAMQASKSTVEQTI